MRVVFMGTPDFAVPSLIALARSHEVVCVYSRPDAVSRRGSSEVACPVKECAIDLRLPVRQPATLRDDAEVEALSELRPDLIAVAAYGLILPPAVLDIPRHGCLNVHASLLPRWRGAAPVQAAILAGDPVTGVSIMRMEEGLDTGPFALQVTAPLEDVNSEELTLLLATEGAAALISVIHDLGSDSVVWTQQDESLALYAPKITKSDVTPHPEMSVVEIVRRVRASGATAPARVVVAGRTMTLTDIASAESSVSQGTVALEGGFLVLGASDGVVRALSVKPDGRHEMPGAACGRGLDLTNDPTWKGVS